MTTPWQRFLLRFVLNFSIALTIGAVAFSIFSFFARADETMIRRVGGAFLMFPLAILFGALVFWLPGMIFSSVTSAMMSYSGRFTSILTPLVAAILGLVLFPAWVVLMDNPLGKGWHLITGIGGLSALSASIITQRITKNANNAIHRTPTRVTPDA